MSTITSTIIILILGIISAIFGVKLLGKDNELQKANKTITTQQKTITDTIAENKKLEANQNEARNQATILAEENFTTKKEKDIALRLNPILVDAVTQYAKNKAESDNLKAQVIEYEKKQKLLGAIPTVIGGILEAQRPVQEAKQPIQPSEYKLVNQNVDQAILDQPIDDDLTAMANALVEKAMRIIDDAH